MFVGRLIVRALGAYSLCLCVWRPSRTMSKNAQTQDRDDAYTNHVPTNGDFAKYLWHENPNCPIDKLAGRFRDEWNAERGKDSLSRIRADFCCPDCGSSDVFYTRESKVSLCEGCGLHICDTDKSADEVLSEGL